MGRYRKIDTRKRADARYRALSGPQPNAQSLWDYLIDCGQDRSIPGLLPLGLGTIAEAFGWSIDGTRAAWAEIEHQGMAFADWRARLIWLPNALRHNPPASSKNVKSWGGCWPEIPECDLKRRARAAARDYLQAKGGGFLECFEIACPSPQVEGLCPMPSGIASEMPCPMASHDHQAPSTKHDHDPSGGDRECARVGPDSPGPGPVDADPHTLEEPVEEIQEPERRPGAVAARMCPRDEVYAAWKRAAEPAGLPPPPRSRSLDRLVDDARADPRRGAIWFEEQFSRLGKSRFAVSKSFTLAQVLSGQMLDKIELGVFDDKPEAQPRAGPPPKKTREDIEREEHAAWAAERRAKKEAGGGR